MEDQEFVTLLHSLMRIPETQNPALYERVERFKHRVHESIITQTRAPWRRMFCRKTVAYAPRSSCVLDTRVWRCAKCSRSPERRKFQPWLGNLPPEDE